MSVSNLLSKDFKLRTFLVTEGLGIRTFRGSITIANPPQASEAEIESAISDAYGEVAPLNGDYVVLQKSGENRVPFFARAVPNENNPPAEGFSFNYKALTINGKTQWFIISQTGAFL